MDRIISAEERVRKAEQIYMKRRGNIQENFFDKEKENIEQRFFTKTIIKILCCIIIYFAFYFIKNSDYNFTKDIISKTNEILSYDMNLELIYDQTSKYMANMINDFADATDENNGSNEQIENSKQENEVINDIQNNQEKNNENMQESIEENNLQNQEIEILK